MRGAAVAPTVLLVVGAAALAAAQEAEPERTWDDLQRSVVFDQSLRVELEDGAVKLGRGVSVNDSSVFRGVVSHLERWWAGLPER